MRVEAWHTPWCDDPDDRLLAYARTRPVMLPKVRIPLLSLSDEAPDEAEVDYTVTPPTITRYRSRSYSPC